MARKPKVHKDDLIFDHEIRRYNHEILLEGKIFNLEPSVFRDEFSRKKVVYNCKELQQAIWKHKNEVQDSASALSRAVADNTMIARKLGEAENEVKRLKCIIGMLRETSTVPDAELIADGVIDESR